MAYKFEVQAEVFTNKEDNNMYTIYCEEDPTDDIQAQIKDYSTPVVVIKGDKTLIVNPSGLVEIIVTPIKEEE